MKTWTIIKKIFIALISHLVLRDHRGGEGIALYLKVDLFVRNERWVSHTNEVMDKLDNILLALVNMENGLRGYAVAGDPKFLAPYDAGKTSYGTNLEEARNLVSDNPAQLERLAKLDEKQQEWQTADVAATRAEREKVTAGDMPEKDFDAGFNQGRGKVFMVAMRAQIQETKDAELALIAVRKANFQTAVASAKGWLLFGLSSAIVLGVGLVGWVLRATSRVLRGIATALNEASGQISAAAEQVSAASQSLAEVSSEQAAALEETSASLEEISSTTKRNADSAENARAIANDTSSATETGTAQMGEMVNAMTAIKTSSDNIAKIIKTIDEIAFQTNILALNAAVEAARAGEAGVGFAVVVDEVRALAQRAAQAAKETVDKIDDSIAKSGHGVEISTKVAVGLNQINEKTKRVNELVVEIATASTEQAQGLGQVGTAVSQMNKITQANAASAEETASAAEELNAQSGALLETVAPIAASRGRRSQHLRSCPHLPEARR